MTDHDRVGVTAAERDALLAAWRAEASSPHRGWDWSRLAGRLHDEPLPWDFDALTTAALADATSLLDLGTGGGERLLAFADLLPADTLATEGWPTNVAVARAALEPRGVTVVEHAPPAPLPLPADRIDLVHSRHMGFDPGEVARVLRPGGVLLTQQVGFDDLADLRMRFGWTPPPGGSGFGALVADLEAAGFQIRDAQEFHGAMTVDDVGALVQYLGLVPWYAPSDFGVDAYADLLLDLHDNGPGRGVPFSFAQSRYLVRAVIPRAQVRRAVPSPPGPGARGRRPCRC